MSHTINVLEFLEESAKKYPQKTAFADDKTSISYQDLVEKAKGFGSYLATKIPQNSPVAILGDKSVEAIISFFGCVYAGCFYVPLNTRYPKERITQILDTLDSPEIVIAPPTSSITLFDIKVQFLTWAKSVLREIAPPSL